MTPILMLCRPSPLLTASRGSPAIRARAGLAGAGCPGGWHGTACSPQPFCGAWQEFSLPTLGAAGQRKGRGEEVAACFARPVLPLVPIPIPTWPRVLSFPDRLGQGFPLPLPDRIQLSNILVRFHQVSEGEHPALAGARPTVPEPPACRHGVQGRFPNPCWEAAGRRVRSAGIPAAQLQTRALLFPSAQWGSGLCTPRAAPHHSPVLKPGA